MYHNTKILYRIWDKRLKQFLSCPSSINIFGRESEDAEYIVQFWTGLKDRNDREIYEGDIVKTNEGGWIAQVVFDREGFVCRDLLKGFSSCCEWEEFEIIGNIFENIELLPIPDDKTKKDLAGFFGNPEKIG